MKKQDKALIHAARARNIRSVLMDPKDTAVESAQFRYVNRYPFIPLQQPATIAPLFDLCLYSIIWTEISNDEKNNRFWVKKMFKLQAIDGQNPEVT